MGCRSSSITSQSGAMPGYITEDCSPQPLDRARGRKFQRPPPSMRARGSIRLIGSALVKRNNTAAQQCMYIRNAVAIESGINGNADQGLNQTVRAHTVAHLLGHKGGHAPLGFLIRHGRVHSTDADRSAGRSHRIRPGAAFLSAALRGCDKGCKAPGNSAARARAPAHASPVFDDACVVGLCQAGRRRTAGTCGWPRCARFFLRVSRHRNRERSIVRACAQDSTQGCPYLSRNLPTYAEESLN
jgi:hypothetical protein